MKQVWNPEALTMELMAFAFVLGVPTCRAPSLVETTLASLDQDGYDSEVGTDQSHRLKAFRLIAEAAPSARPDGAGLGWVEAARAISEISTGPFRMAPYDLKGALYLVSALDFGLDEAAAVLGSDAVSLSWRLEQLLDQIEQPDAHAAVAGTGSRQTLS